MGITNLLQFLRPMQKCVSIKSHAGSVVVVDAMCWIHRGMISSAVANVTGENSDNYIKFIVSMLSVLLSNDITPIMVFDGYDMPSKERENQNRRDRREKAKAEALEMIRKNKGAINTEIMRKCMQAITITPEVVCRVIEVCRKMNVRVLVSPYEADAQVAYLCRSGVAHAAISEDSDLLAYGCPRVWYKLERDGRADELRLGFSNNPDEKCTKGLLKGISHRMFVDMCVLSGSDYDDGCHIHGMGIKLAHRFILQFETIPAIMAELEENASWAKKLPTHVTVKQLEDHYLNVSNIFLHNVVYDIGRDSLTHMNPVPNGAANMSIIIDLCSRIRQKNDYKAVSEGRVNPRTGEPLSYAMTDVDNQLTEGMRFKTVEGVTNTGNSEDSTTTGDLLIPTTWSSLKDEKAPKEAEATTVCSVPEAKDNATIMRKVVTLDPEVICDNPPQRPDEQSTDTADKLVVRQINEDFNASISTCDEFELPTKSQKSKIRELINASEKVSIVRRKRACTMKSIQ